MKYVILTSIVVYSTFTFMEMCFDKKSYIRPGYALLISSVFTSIVLYALRYRIYTPSLTLTSFSFILFMYSFFMTYTAVEICERNMLINLLCVVSVICFGVLSIGFFCKMIMI